MMMYLSLFFVVLFVVFAITLVLRILEQKNNH